MATLTAMPTRFTAGTTIRYTRTFSAYPASDFDLTLVVAGEEYLATANVDGVSFDVVITNSQSAVIPPGTYRWLERVSDGGDVIEPASGLVTVDQDLATLTAQESLSYAERTLQVIELALAGRLPRALAGYAVDGITVQYDTDINALEKLRVKYAREVERLKRGANPGLGKAHKFAFRGR
jgi:hypothetical protein